MLYSLLVFACVLAFVTADFAAWKLKHGKSYATEAEEAIRRFNYEESVVRIAAANKKSPHATYALNKFSDLSPAEFKAMYLSKVVPPAEKIEAEVITPKVKDVPAKFDWRDHGAVTPVKNQEQCGSCWAFSVTENIESVWILAGHASASNLNLAPQQIVDCDSSDGGCNGGYPTTAYQYVENAGGLESAADYPYTAENGQCKFQQSDVVAKISGWKYATTERDEETLKKNLVGESALSICVDAQYWQDYQSGVMGGWECAWINELDHCVQLVGYDTTASTPYWMVRNSWGTDWGIDGYIWLEMGENTCGLTNVATTSIAA